MVGRKCPVLAGFKKMLARTRPVPVSGYGVNSTQVLVVSDRFVCDTSLILP